MGSDFPDWVHFGTGRSPDVRWTHLMEGPITAASLARETSEYFVADETGALYRIAENGQIANLNRLSTPIRQLAWSDVGSHGVAIQGSRTISRLDRKLRTDWEIELDKKCLTVAIDPFANFSVISMADRGNLILDRNHKQAGVFAAFRPIHHLGFLAEEAAIIAAGDSGVIGCYSVRGKEYWNERIWSSTGALTVSEGDGQIYTAGFAQGVMRFTLAGKSKGAFLLEGTTNRIASSYTGEAIFVSTMENQIYLLDSDGDIKWSATPPEPIETIHADPLGHWVILGMESGQINCLGW